MVVGALIRTTAGSGVFLIMGAVVVGAELGLCTARSDAVYV
jgi:hypothetical protein